MSRRSPRRLRPLTTAAVVLLLAVPAGPARIAARAAETSPPAPGAPAGIMPFAEVAAGMRGKGLTVFRAGTIEEFDVEILGKLEKIGPDQNLILAKLSGGPLAETGVIEGMSGSPVTVEGRLIGAVAYSWGFARDAIAGITPIEEMIRIEKESPAGAAPAASGAVRLPAELRSPTARVRTADLVRYYRDTIADLFAPPPVASGRLRRIAVPVAVAGLPSPLGSFLGVPGLTAGQIQGSPATPVALPPLQGGSAVGVALVDGDVQMTAVGTVTRVDGDRLLAFGHPLFNLGPVELPMTRARVEALLPSLQSSFKLAGPAGEAGSVIADRASGIAGRIGRPARTIPVRLELDTGAGAVRTYRFEVADHPRLSPTLIFLTLGGLFSASRTGEGEISIDMREGSVIRLSRNRTVSVADLYAGDDAALVASATVAFLSQILMENEWEPARIEGIDLTAVSSDTRRTARITGAWAGRTQVHAGETLDVAVTLQPFRGEERTVRIGVEIPTELPPGRLTLHIGDALALYRTEAEASAGQYPRDLDHLLELINSLRRSEEIHLLATRRERSIWVNGRPLPNLPASKASLFAGPEAGGGYSAVGVRPVLEARLSTGFSISGYRRIELEVVR